MVLDISKMALRVEGVSKSYGTRTVLQSIGFEVAIGQRVALLGPNGAGKTTLIRTVCGRTSPQSGSVSIFGNDPRLPEAKTLFGVIPQDLAIYEDLTAQENLQAFGRLQGVRGRELTNQVDRMLQWIRLDDRRHDQVKSFSGGMKRRVNIACGLLHRPGLILLDEPTVGVDPQSRHRIHQMLDELHAAGATILWTTHHLEEAQEKCDRIIILDHGQIIADGSLHQLVHSTVGPKQRVEIAIDGELGSSPRHWTWQPNRQRWTAQVSNVAMDLGPLLDEVSHAGGRVLHVDVHTPSLQDVFLHLTGRELRE